MANTFLPPAQISFPRQYFAYPLHRGALARIVRFSPQPGDSHAGVRTGSESLHCSGMRPAKFRFTFFYLPSWAFFSFSACSAVARALMISSRSPFITSSIRYRVSPTRWSVTRPWGKL